MTEDDVYYIYVCHADLSGQTHPIDVTSQWQDDWKSALVITLPWWMTPLSGLPRRYWTQLKKFQTNQDHQICCHIQWALQQVTSVSVANVKQCFISSTAAHSSSWMVAYHSFTWLKMPLFDGWCCVARNALHNNKFTGGISFTFLALQQHHRWQMPIITACRTEACVRTTCLGSIRDSRMARVWTGDQ